MGKDPDKDSSKISTTEAKDILAAAAHQLKGSLQRMEINLEILRRRTAAGEIVEALEKDVKRLRLLVRDAIEYRLLDNEPQNSAPSVADLSQILEKLVADNRRLFERSALSIKLALPQEAMPASVCGNELERVFDELLQNALKYAPENTAVTIKTERHIDSWLVEICNDGPVLSDEELQRIFEPFYKGESATPRRNDGSGLGLAIAGQLVHKNSGRIYAVSGNAGGLCVCVELPLA